MICPNKNHPEYKQMVKELGSSLAHYYWNENNGNPLGFTPKGDRSDLYGDISSRLLQDKKELKVDKVKSTIYNDAFISQLGDWRKGEFKGKTTRQGEPHISHLEDIMKTIPLSREDVIYNANTANNTMPISFGSLEEEIGSNLLNKEEISEFLSENLEDSELIEIAKKALQETTDIIDINSYSYKSFRDEISPTAEFTEEYEESTPGGRIEIGLRKVLESETSDKKARVARILAHELVHSVTADTLNRDNKYSRRLKTLHRKFKENTHKLKNHYSSRYIDALNNDSHEFYAEVFSSPELYRDIQNIDEGNVSILDKILNSILDFLGIKRSFRNKLKNALHDQMQNEGSLTGEIDPYTYKARNYYLEESEQNMINTELGKEYDENGNEEDFYIYTDQNGNKHKVGRVTKDFVESAIPKEKKGRDFVQTKADKLFKNYEENEKRTFEEFKDDEGNELDLTKEEYITLRRKNIETAKARGRIREYAVYSALEKSRGNDEQVQKYELEMERLAELHGIQEYEFSFINQKIKNDRKKRSFLEYSLENLGTGYDFLVEGGKDHVFNNVQLYNDILKIGGEADLMIKRPNGRWSVIDIKGGNFYSHNIRSSIGKSALMTILRHGKQRNLITDDARSLAKLQIVMYMVLAKANNPNIKFDYGHILSLASKKDALYRDLDSQPDMRSYLELIRDLLRDPDFIEDLNAQREKEGLEKISKNAYSQLMKKSPRLFNLKDYYYYDYRDDHEAYAAIKKAGGVSGTDSGSGRLKAEKVIENELIKWQAIRTDKTHRRDRRKVEQINKKIQDLSEELIRLRSDGIDLSVHKDDAVGFVNYLINEGRDYKLPHLNILQREMDRAMRDSYRNFDRKTSRLDTLADKMAKEWAKRYGIPYNRALQNINYDFKRERDQQGHFIANPGVYEEILIKEAPETSPTGTNIKRLIGIFKADQSNIGNLKKMADMVKKTMKDDQGREKEFYITKKDEYLWDTLTSTQVEYLAEANKIASEYFVNGEGNNVAYMNEIVYNDLTTDEKGNIIEDEENYKTRIQHYNEILDKSFDYFIGWFPKAGKLSEEIRLKRYRKTTGKNTGAHILGLLSQLGDREFWTYQLTRYEDIMMENHQVMNNQMPIPYLGNKNIEEEESYSFNINYAFNKFVRKVEQKRELDPVYITSKGLIKLLESSRFKSHEDDEELFEYEKKYLEKVVPYILTGRWSIERKSGDTGGGRVFSRHLTTPLGITYNNSRMRIDIPKIYRGLVSWSSKSMILGSFKIGMGNGMHMLLRTQRDGLKASVDKRLVNMFNTHQKDEYDPNKHTDFTEQDLAFAMKELGKYAKDWAAGNNKLYENKLWLFSKDFLVLPKDYEGNLPFHKLKGMRNKHLEESVFYLFQSIPDEAMSLLIVAAQLNRMKHTINGKSLWDNYEVDSETKRLKWIGGTRGKIKKVDTNGQEYDQDVQGITREEIEKIKYVQNRIMGGYRRTESTLLDATMIGFMFTKLKTYLWRVLKNQFRFAREVEDLGYWQTVEEFDKDRQKFEKGEIPMLEWRSRVEEGRIITLFKLFGAFFTFNGKKASEIWNTPERRQNIIDAALTASMYWVLSLAYGSLFDDEDEDDTMAQIWERYMMDNPSQLYNPVDMGRNFRGMFTPVLASAGGEHLMNVGRFLSNSVGAALGSEDASWTYEQSDRVKYGHEALQAIPSAGMIVKTLQDLEGAESVFGKKDFIGGRY